MTTFSQLFCCSIAATNASTCSLALVALVALVALAKSGAETLFVFGTAVQNANLIGRKPTETHIIWDLTAISPG